MEDQQLWVIIGSVFAGLGVVLGAFGAHVLEGIITPERLETFETGVRYQMYHSLAILFLATLMKTYQNLTIIGWSWVIGIIIFSGSLYLLVLTDTSWLGAITPIGGVSFIVGWLLLAYRILQQ